MAKASATINYQFGGPALRSSQLPRKRARVVVLGGGNAGICAAISAADAGAMVILIECAPRDFRGGNSRHTRNIRTAHTRADGYVTSAYSKDEFLSDLISVTGPEINRKLATLAVDESQTLPDWMHAHGVHWQPPLKGTLHLARTNHFFLGGGKAMLNAYYEQAERLNIEVRYETRAVDLRMTGDRCTAVTVNTNGKDWELPCDAVIVASGGFEANREWLRQYWGPRADNFVIRGTPYNDGLLLRRLFDKGAEPIGEPLGIHAIAVDARAPAYDGGIVTRLDSIPLGIVVNREAERFYDEGEDLWPKRYASWGRLIADQPDQLAYSIFDAKVADTFIPAIYRPFTADSIPALADMLGLDRGQLNRTVDKFNRHIPKNTSIDLSRLDGSSTVYLQPPKSNWARPIDTAPFNAYPLRPGVTFTYMGVSVNEHARVTKSGEVPFDNVYAAGEIMAGNILTRGYLAGFGLTIGSVFGRLAGKEAAQHA